MNFLDFKTIINVAFKQKSDATFLVKYAKDNLTIDEFFTLFTASFDISKDSRNNELFLKFIARSTIDRDIISWCKMFTYALIHHTERFRLSMRTEVFDFDCGFLDYFVDGNLNKPLTVNELRALRDLDSLGQKYGVNNDAYQSFGAIIHGLLFTLMTNNTQEMQHEISMWTSTCVPQYLALRHPPTTLNDNNLWSHLFNPLSIISEEQTSTYLDLLTQSINSGPIHFWNDSRFLEGLINHIQFGSQKKKLLDILTNRSITDEHCYAATQNLKHYLSENNDPFITPTTAAWWQHYQLTSLTHLTEHIKLSTPAL
jgi:hypothetical protein